MKIRLSARQWLIMLHDTVSTGTAMLLTWLMRFDEPVLATKLKGLEIFVPMFMAYAAVVYLLIGLHRKKWRFTSVPDLASIVRASSILAVSLLMLDYVLVAPNVY